MAISNFKQPLPLPQSKPPQTVPDYNTDVEYCEQNLMFLGSMHQWYLEEVRKIESLLKDMQEDLKCIKTPELKPLVEKIINDHVAKKKQYLEIIKRSRKDLGFVNSIYKKIKEIDGKK